MIRLITYADHNYKLAAKLLIHEAKSLHLFDRCHCYTQNEIQDFLSDKWIAKEKRGAGYWIWKPYIVSLELQKMKEGDILLYVDAGCSFRNTPRWKEYFNTLEKHDAIFMRFNPKVNYGFVPTVRCWTKKTVVQYFKTERGEDSWLDMPQFIGGCFFIKKTHATLNFVKQWSDFICAHQELVCDVLPEEKDQDVAFVEHRHDQAILSLLLYTSKEKNNFKYLDEDIEWHDNMDNGNRAIVAERRNDEWIRKNKSTVVKRYIKHKLSCIKNN